MNTIDTVFSRRAIKHFDSSHKLSDEEEKKLFEAVIQSPTSFNIQHWRYLQVLKQEGLLCDKDVWPRKLEIGTGYRFEDLFQVMRRLARLLWSIEKQQHKV